MFASSTMQHFQAFPSLEFVRGADRWAADLIPTLDRLKSNIDAATFSPDLLRAYFRAESAYFHGGYRAFDRSMDERIKSLVGSFEAKPPTGSLETYRTLLKENGGRVSVAYGLATGQVSNVQLNPSFRIGRDFQRLLPRLLTRGKLAKLIGLDSRDELRLQAMEQVPAGIHVQLYRFRNSVPVVPDFVSVFLHKTTTGEYYLDSINVSVGRVGSASCNEADPLIRRRYDPTGEVGMSDVCGTMMLARLERRYRCIYYWQATYYVPEEEDDYPFFRLVDARTGEIYADDWIMLADGSDTDTHEVRVTTVVPYVNLEGSDNGFNDVSTLPGLELHLYTRDPSLSGIWIQEGAEHLTDISLGDPPDRPQFNPVPDFDPYLGETSGPYAGLHHDSPLVAYMVKFAHDPPGIFKFDTDPDGFYTEGFEGYLWNELLLSYRDHGPDNIITYQIPWTRDNQIWEEGDEQGDPEANCPVFLRPSDLPQDGWVVTNEYCESQDDCADVFVGIRPTICDDVHFFPSLCVAPGRDQHCADQDNRARAFAAQLYFYSQYARYIWSCSDAQGRIWSDGPYTNDGNDRWVRLKVSDRQHGLDRHRCMHWAGGRKIKVRVNRRDRDGHVACRIHNVTTGLPHEFGHWVNNVLPVGAVLSSSAWRKRGAGYARNEGYADYYSTSLNANWHVHRIPHYQHGGTNYDAEGVAWQQYPDPDMSSRLDWFRGNRLYAQLDRDHHHTDGAKTHAYLNSFVWSSTVLQYMNLAGNMYSDPALRAAYYGTCRDSVLGKDWLHREDWQGRSWDDIREAAREVLWAMIGWEKHRDLADHANDNNMDVIVSTRQIEMQRAFLDHHWTWRIDDQDDIRKRHNASMSPSHAQAITLNDHQPSMTQVRWDDRFDTKWVNFFVSANVQYVLRAMGPNHSVLRLFHVIETQNRDEVSSGLQGIAMSTGCMSPTIRRQTGGMVDVVENNPVGLCQGGGGHQGDSTIVFTPRQSGWYYASAYAGHESVGTIILSTTDDNRQITSTNRGAVNGVFERDVEVRLGQSIPVNIPNEDQFQGFLPHPTEVYRFGVFKGGVQSEEHYWRFQVVPTRRFVDPSDPEQQGWSEKEPMLAWPIPGSSGGTYSVVITTDDQDSDRYDVLPHIYVERDSVLKDLNVTFQWVPRAGGLRELVGTVSMDELGDLRAGQNVYVLVNYVGYLRRRSPHVEYAIRVDSKVPDGQGHPEDDSNIFNPMELNRWCAEVPVGEHSVTKMERVHHTFTVTERLSYGDADYFHVWLQEGEHLNITYRGGLPAALDVSGTGRVRRFDVDPTAPQDETIQYPAELDYVWPTWISANTTTKDNFVVYRRRADSGVESNHITGWRPVLYDGADAFCPDHGYLNCDQNGRGQFFADRGYLWSFNKPPHVNNDFAGTPDNAVQLTFTAFITGPYIIRVRGQAELYPDSDMLTYNPHSAYGNGVPYTLNVNLGVAPNRRRPHWQFLDDQDPATEIVPANICGR